jgi:hypothetical protein
MRTLIFSLFFTSIAAYGSKSAGTDLFIERKGHRLVQQTRITEKDGTWTCDTEVAKDYPLAGKPEFLDHVEQLSSKPNPGCEDSVNLSLRRGKKTSKKNLCAQDQATKKFLRQIAKVCGR